MVQEEDAPEVALPRYENLSQVLLDRPPGERAVAVERLAKKSTSQYGAKMNLITPSLQLPCESELCGGDRVYTCVRGKDAGIADGEWTDIFLTYQCKNCGRGLKKYALLAYAELSKAAPLPIYEGSVLKLGEYPAYGGALPARVLRLVQPDKDLFLQGWRAEKQGMGIGAFAYYRRVIENQKNRILDEVIKAAGKEGADPALLEELEAAKTQKQFSKAVESVKHALPSGLNINGQNPLLLLHDALSDGLHNDDDDGCLEAAGAARLIMSAFAERLAHLTAERTELNDAVARLHQRRQGK